MAASTSAIASLYNADVAYIHGMSNSGAMLALAGGALRFPLAVTSIRRKFTGAIEIVVPRFMLSTMSILGPVKCATMVAVIIPVLVLANLDTARDIPPFGQQAADYGGGTRGICTTPDETLVSRTAAGAT